MFSRGAIHRHQPVSRINEALMRVYRPRIEPEGTSTACIIQPNITARPSCFKLYESYMRLEGVSLFVAKGVARRSWMAG